MMLRAIVLAVLCALAGCSQPRRNIVVYSPHGKEMLRAFELQFESTHPGVDVQWLDMGSQDAYDRIRTERGNPQADIWWGAPSITFAAAEAESLLERYEPTWAAAVPRESQSAGGFWFGTFLTPEVIMYNNRRITEAEAPKDWDDLLDPKWRDKIVIRYPLASGTMRIIYSALIQREARRTGNDDAGFLWLRRLDANTKTYVADPTQLYLKIGREEGLVSLWNLPDVVIQTKTNGYPFGYAVPASGTPVITDCIAIVRGTKNREEAEMFYEFVTSRDALVRQANEFFRIPARTDIPADALPDWIRTLALTPMPLDWQSLGKNEQSWMKRWDEEVKGTGRQLTQGNP